MAQTPSGNLTSWLPANLYVRMIDARWVADKLSSDGVRVGGNSDGTVDLVALAANQDLVNSLSEASGLFEAALMKGKRYTKDDILALTGNSLRFMYRLIANLTTGILLVDRRPESGMELTPSYLMALEWLSQLAEGEMIFSFAETQLAGLLSDRTDTPETVRARNGLVVSAVRLFGVRNNEQTRVQ